MAIGGVNVDWRTGSQAAPTTLVDYTQKTVSVDLNVDNTLEQSTTFGDTSHTYEVGFKDGTINVTYNWDATIHDIVEDAWTQGTAVNFQLSPAGTASGARRVTGSAYVMSIGMPHEVGGIQQFNVEYKITGDATFGAHP